MKKKSTCFIITPICNKKDDIRRHVDGIIEAVIIPAIGDDYDIKVSHKMSEIGSISKQIIKEIYDSKLVIANLTNINPNVMYELAFRHSTGKPVIIIAEEGTTLPFDVSVERTIFYRNDAQGTLELCENLKEYIAKIDFDKSAGPIHDIVGEIVLEKQFLNNMDGANLDEDSKPMEFILSRLNMIEDLVRGNAL